MRIESAILTKMTRYEYLKQQVATRHDPTLHRTTNALVDTAEMVGLYWETEIKPGLFSHGLKTKDRYPSCLRCSLPVCCRVLVPAGLLDGMPLARWARVTGRDTPAFRGTLETLDREMRAAGFDGWRALERPCLLQNPETFRCEAYEVRPVPCRTFYSYSPEEYCRDPTQKLDNIGVRTFDVEALRYEYEVNGGFRRRIPYRSTLPGALLDCLRALDIRASKDAFKRFLQTVPGVAPEEWEQMAPKPKADQSSS